MDKSKKTKKDMITEFPQDFIQVPMDLPVMGFDGKPLMENGERVCVGPIIAYAFANMSKKGQDPQSKYIQGKLARQWFKDGVVSLNQRHSNIAKELIANMANPHIVAFIWDVLDQLWRDLTEKKKKVTEDPKKKKKIETEETPSNDLPAASSGSPMPKTKPPKKSKDNAVSGESKK